MRPPSNLMSHKRLDTYTASTVPDSAYALKSHEASHLNGERRLACTTKQRQGFFWGDRVHNANRPSPVHFSV